MKKKIVLCILAVSVILSLCLLAGCGTEDTSPEDTINTSSTAATTEKIVTPNTDAPQQGENPDDQPDATEPVQPPTEKPTEPEKPTAPQEKPTEPEKPIEPEKPAEPEDDPGCLEHEYRAWEMVKAATCLVAGTETSRCIHCGAETERAISAKGHTEETIPGTPATCTSAGKTDGKSCTICGVVTVPQKTIPMKNHTRKILPAKAATCSEEGLTEGEKCSDCGMVFKAQTTIAKKDHKIVTVAAKKPTCTENGLTEGKQCSVCKTFTMPQQSIPAKGHTFTGWQVVKEATCSEPGLKRSTCNECSATSEKEIPATGIHEYINGVCSCGDEIKGSAGLTFRLSSDGTYYICTGMNSYTLKNEIIIPSYYNGKPVKEIESGTGNFPQCKKLVIMEGITKIGNSAFYYNDSLKEVYLPKSLTLIESGAFYGCKNLETVYVETTGWVKYKTTGKFDQNVSFSNPYTAAEWLRTKHGDFKR